MMRMLSCYKLMNFSYEVSIINIPRGKALKKQQLIEESEPRGVCVFSPTFSRNGTPGELITITIEFGCSRIIV